MKEDFWDADSCYGTVSEERIKFVEEVVGITFPKSYRELVKRCDGGYPLKGKFNYYDEYDQEILPGSIGVFLKLNEASSETVLELFYGPPEFFPENILIFAEVGCGDFICFDYRDWKDNIDPPIVYWRHGAEDGKDVSFVAPNFDAFMKILYRSEYVD